MSGVETAARMRESRAAFLEAVDGVRPDAEVVGAWTVREVLAHGSAWIQLLLWMLDRDHPDARSDHSAVDDFNRRAAQAAAGRPLSEVRAEFERVSDAALALIAPLSAAELDRPGRFEWDPQLTLARAIEENGYAHFDEHSGQLRNRAGLP